MTTPMRTDSAFEKDLFESLPLDEHELQQYSIQYKGSYRFHTGAMQWMTITRFDIELAIKRISEYNSSPTAVSFQCIGRLSKYLAKDILRPLMYPRGDINGTTTLTALLSKETPVSIEIPNHLSAFSDAEFACHLASRRSYTCVMILLMGVGVYMKIRKTDAIMTHTTDAEMRASFHAVRDLQPLRAQLEFMGFPSPAPTRLHIDNAAVDSIIDANRITPRVRHIDIPIAYLHAHHNKTFTKQLIRTHTMLADLGTKPLVALLHKRFKYWAMGEIHYPKRNTEHWKRLDMHWYEVSLLTLIQDLHND